MPHPPRILTVNGVARPLPEWASLFRIPPETIRVRLDRLGWDETRAVMTPADTRFRRGGRPPAGVPRSVPRMTRHKSSNRARVCWRAHGRRHTRYLGAWGSAEARRAYARFCAEWAAGTHDAPALIRAVGGVTIGELVVRRLAFARNEYRKAGRLTSEFNCQRAALAVLNDLYGSSPAAEFGPLDLKAARAAMIEKGWARDSINRNVSRLVAVFGWAVGEGLIPAAVPAALREVSGLKAGKTTAPERRRKRPVPDADLAAVLPHLSPIPERAARLAAAVQLQRLTGMRPGEVCALRPCDLDTSGDVWLYTVADESNKNLHRGKSQSYWIGPRGQALLRPHLGGPADRRVFRVSRGGYGLAVRLACELAGVPAWTPHQLRHSLATDVARATGDIKAAGAAIGDTPEAAARYYVEIDPAERAKIEWARTRG